MQIAIIGAGNVGVSLGKGWSCAGYQIQYGVTDPEATKHQRVLQEVAGAAIVTVKDAAQNAEVIVLAVPWSAVFDVVNACGKLTNKILVDATNPLSMGKEGLQLAVGFTTSGSEEVARVAVGASVFKTMNQVGYDVMCNTQGYPFAPIMFVAGDDDAQKPVVLSLVAALGFEAVDAGPLRNARLLEPYAMLWIDQAMKRGASRTNAFGMLRKESTL